MLFFILVGMVFSAHAGDVTLEELEQKMNNLEKLEQNMERLEKEFITMQDKLETKNISEEIMQTIDTSTKQRLSKIEENVGNSEKEIAEIKEQLEYGGKNFQIFPNNSAVQLKDQDYLKLQVLSTKDGWLGCPDTVCDLRTCPSRNSNYLNFDGRCWGEEFQIIGEGTLRNPIKCGQRIRLRYLHEQNTWMGCPSKRNYCDKRTCPGTTAEGSNFANSRCWGEIFRIYARGKANGQILYSGDVVMLYYERGGRYVSIQGENFGDDTSLNFCPGITPPAYLSYGTCSRNAFRIYRKP